jgi:RNA polymerase sigma-70 factor (ECF subfamily)
MRCFEPDEGTLDDVDDTELVIRLTRGDQQAFEALVRRYQASMIQVARYYVGSQATAEDVVQETWVAVFRGIGTFEGRSTFKTWLFRILANRAHSAGVREHRSVPVDPQSAGSTVAVSRFDDGGMWTEPPVPFEEAIDDAQSDPALVNLVRSVIDGLDEPGKTVVTLRDVEGLSTREAADILGLSEANVRVILHRTRAKIREAIEEAKGGRT